MDLEEGDDGGVFSGLATTTFLLEVKDLVGVFGASSKALTKDAIAGKTDQIKLFGHFCGPQIWRNSGTI